MGRQTTGHSQSTRKRSRGPCAWANSWIKAPLVSCGRPRTVPHRASFALGQSCPGSHYMHRGKGGWGWKGAQSTSKRKDGQCGWRELQPQSHQEGCWAVNGHRCPGKWPQMAGWESTRPGDLAWGCELSAGLSRKGEWEWGARGQGPQRWPRAGHIRPYPQKCILLWHNQWAGVLLRMAREKDSLLSMLQGWWEGPELLALGCQPVSSSLISHTCTAWVWPPLPSSPETKDFTAPSPQSVSFTPSLVL